MPQLKTVKKFLKKYHLAENKKLTLRMRMKTLKNFFLKDNFHNKTKKKLKYLK